MDKSFLGTGMKFPPQINPATGRFVTASGAQSIKESIYVILMTNKTERLARPSFGTDLSNFTFMDAGITLTNMLIRDLKKNIADQEPRIKDVAVDIEDQTAQGRLIINIGYTIIDSNTRDNLVFPYYLEQTEEDEAQDMDEYIDEYADEYAIEVDETGEIFEEIIDNGSDN